LTQLFI
jgi:hypothetical protein